MGEGGRAECALIAPLNRLTSENCDLAALGVVFRRFPQYTDVSAT